MNVPDARRVAVVDIGQGKQVASLELGGARSNFPMAVDARRHRVLVVTRSPSRLIAFSTEDNKRVATVDACGDGLVEVFGARGEGYDSIGQVPTASGARTALFVADDDRLYVAVRARFREPAAIWVFRPTP